MFKDDKNKYQLSVEEIIALQEFLNNKVTINVDMTEAEFRNLLSKYNEIDMQFDGQVLKLVKKDHKDK